MLRGADLGRRSVDDDNLALLDTVLDSLLLLGWRRPVAAPWLGFLNVGGVRHCLSKKFSKLSVMVMKKKRGISQKKAIDEAKAHRGKAEQRTRRHRLFAVLRGGKLNYPACVWLHA